MIKFKVVLIPKYILTISSGKPEELMTVDIVFSRKKVAKITKEKIEYEDVLYVPGSTLKGVLRTSACRVASILGYTCCNEVEPSRIETKHRDMNKICHVCELFGYPGGPKSLIRVGDGEIEKEYVDYTTRLAVDDAMGVGRDGALFTSETIVGNGSITFPIWILRDDIWIQRLILMSLVELVYNGIGRGSGIGLKIMEARGFDRKDEIVSQLLDLLERGVEF